MKRRSFFLCCLALCLTTAPASASDIMVMEAYARASLTPMAKSASAYMVLMNHGAGPDALLALESPAAQRVEIHETQNIDGIMKMRPVERLELPQHESIKLEPGGYHIMLMGLAEPLKDGETISLSLTFAKAGVVTVDVPVRKLAPLAADHDHDG